MQTLNLIQGSPQWHAHRASYFNASDAPAMMGVSPYRTRTELLHQMHTGIAPEVDASTQRRFDDGHHFEALARPLAEKIVGEDLYPVVGVFGELSASFDGITLMEEVAFEHKSLNDELRAIFKDIETIAPEHRDRAGGKLLPLLYQVQMEQQCMVSGAQRVLFMATKWAGNELVEARHCWYYPNAELAARIRTGWKQFADDLKAYRPSDAVADAPIGKAPETLPALYIEVTGKVTASNLAEFKETALAAIRSVNRDLTTDADFADAEKAVKWCADIESRLAAAKEHALSQTASIDALFKTIDDIGAEARRVRLDLDKVVKLRKESIRMEIVMSAQAALDEHVGALNKRLGANWLPRMIGGFAEAIKGKKTVASVKEAASVALANAKIDASALADRLDANRKALVIDGTDWFFLFADFAVVGAKQVEDFEAIAAQRIQKHIDDNAARAARALAEQARIAAAAEAVRLAQQNAQGKEPERALDPVTTGACVNPGVEAAQIPASSDEGKAAHAEQRAAEPALPDTRPPITTGALCDLFGLVVNADFVRSLGLTPAPRPENAKSGTFWHRADVPLLCDRLIVHISQVKEAACKSA